ncbi:MAG: hypothetical protein HQL66_06065 [Magnetococcales bacterium]|nr:hypothetical protein [Magnetococcales bacterium]
MALIVHSGRSRGYSCLHSGKISASGGLTRMDATAVDLHFAHKLAHHSRKMFKPVQRIFRETTIHQVIRSICTESIGAMLMSPTQAEMNWLDGGLFPGGLFLNWGSSQTLQ